MGVKALFGRGARLFPDRLCVDDGHTQLTYREVDDLSRRMGAALRAAGVERGAKVSLLSPNCAEAMLAILAIYQADCVFVPLNAAMPLGDHERTLSQLGVCAVFFHSSFAVGIDVLARKHQELAVRVCLDQKADGHMSLDELLELPAPSVADDPPSRPDDLIAIYPTGGSTGPPKRAMHTRLVWETMAACYLTATPAPEPPVFLMAPPITHAAGTYAMMMMPIGSTTIIQNGFDAAQILDAIERHRVTHLFLPPTAIYKLLEHPGIRGRDFSSLRAFIYTAAPMSVEKLRQCMEIFGPVMVQFWGQTEAPCFCTCLPAAEHVVGDAKLEARLASCGRETAFVRVGVMDDEGRLLAAGERGELVVRSNLVMSGYYENAEATEAASRFGWHHTGDVGFKDEDGYVYIVGRKSDMIVTGGYNVYPADIEQVLWAHPAIEECAVIGVPDEKWGEAVLAVVQPKQGAHVVESELVALCKEKLGSVRAPKRIVLSADIPRNAVGKVDKVALREPYWRGRARKV